MLPPKKTRDLARSLVASEALANSASLHSEPVTVRVYERLRRQLGAPVGADGFQSIATRALALARSESPQLRAVQVMANGTLRGLSEVESQTNPDENGEAGIILIAQLLGLFLTLLGEATTLHLIEDLRLQTEVRPEPVTTTADIADSVPEELANRCGFRGPSSGNQSIEECVRSNRGANRYTSRYGRWTPERRWKHTQHCHGFGRFHAHPQ